MSDVTIRVNDREVTTRSGATLLEALLDAAIPVETACGGQARCHLCRVTITEGRDSLPRANPVEYKALGNVLIAQGMRLACQVEVTEPLSVTVPEPRPKRRRGPPPRPPQKPAPEHRRSGRGHEERSGPEERPGRDEREGSGRSERREAVPRDEERRAAVSSEEPTKKKRRRRPRRRRKKSEGT